MGWLSKTIDWCRAFEEKKNQSSQVFHEIAYDSLASHNWQEGFDLDTFLFDFIPVSKDVPQVNSSFGDPSKALFLTLFMSQDKSFILDLYIWMDANTSIHNHYFEGAFHLLQGTSIEAKYDFEGPEYRDKPVWGELIPKELKILETGETRPIQAFEEMIHKVLHLTKPTVSLVLRTNLTPTTKSQVNYNFGKLICPSELSEEIFAKKRILEWYLINDKTIPAELLNQLIDYPETWKSIARYPKLKNWGIKLALAYQGQSFLENYDKSAIYQRLFIELTDHREKIMLTAYEFLGPLKWHAWIEAQNAKNICSVEDFKQSILASKLNQERDLTNTNFLNPLFE